VGAIITRLIIPNFTRQWQDHQKELEVKIALTDEINKATSDINTATALMTYSAFVNKTDYGSAFRDWKVSQAEIASKIKSYYSNNQLIQDWKNLSLAIEQYLSLVTSRLPAKISSLYRINPLYNYSYYYDTGACLRISNVLLLHKIYPQTNPINIDNRDLNTYDCGRFYLPGIPYAQQISHHYPIKHKNDIDWYGLIHIEDMSTNMSAIKGRQNSFANIQKYINNSKDSLLDKIFRSKFDIFQ